MVSKRPKRAHNPKVVGSNPTPATIISCNSKRSKRRLMHLFGSSNSFLTSLVKGVTFDKNGFASAFISMKLFSDEPDIFSNSIRIPEGHYVRELAQLYSLNN